MVCFKRLFQSKSVEDSFVLQPDTNNANNNVQSSSNIQNTHKNALTKNKTKNKDSAKTSKDSADEKQNSKSLIEQSVLEAGIQSSTVASSNGGRCLVRALEDEEAIDDEIYRNFNFPFENLVFEGGGNKGMAYTGVLTVLEKAGIANKIKRVSGASVGAIAATMFAVGFSADDLKQFMEQDLKKVLIDHKCGYCSLLPNLLNGFGWNPGKKLMKWFGDQLAQQTGNAEITFREVLKTYGRELCIVVTNLSQMSTEYFHPKTTPNTPVKLAVRMSISLPGVFQSVKYGNEENGNYDVYVDGGLLCNYPIHAFDGWWLSMDQHDSFFKRLQPLDNYAKLFSKSERFGIWNPRTIGIMLYSHTETELMKTKLAERQGTQVPQPPNSKLYRRRFKMREKQAAANEEHHAVVSAVGRFMKELHRMNYDLDGTVSFKELTKVFDMSAIFTLEDRMLLFGNQDIEQAFNELDRDRDGEVTFQELMAFVEKKGINVQTRFLGYTRKEINSLGDFISTLQTALSINVKRNYVEERDIDRTIGIDTDYIESNDFILEEEDKMFLLKSGEGAARAFLRHYCKSHPQFRKKCSTLLASDHFMERLQPSTHALLHPMSPHRITPHPSAHSPDVSRVKRPEHPSSNSMLRTLETPDPPGSSIASLRTLRS